MKKFNQFDIKETSTSFEGDKIKINKVLNQEIIVHAFKVEDSKVYQDRGTGKCLYLQISINGEKRIIFTSSRGLLEAIQQVPDDGFPFTTTIVQVNERYKFT